MEKLLKFNKQLHLDEKKLFLFNFKLKKNLNVIQQPQHYNKTKLQKRTNERTNESKKERKKT